METLNFTQIKDSLVSVGGVLIPLALYYVKTEIGKSGDRIENKLDLHIQAFKNHCDNDEDYQGRMDKSVDQIKDKLKII